MATCGRKACAWWNCMTPRRGQYASPGGPGSRSTARTWWPRRASAVPVSRPAGPAPMTATSIGVIASYRAPCAADAPVESALASTGFLPGSGSHRDDDLAPRSAGRHVRDGGRRLLQRVGPLDHRGHLARFDEVGEGAEVGRLLRGDEHAQVLADERRQQHTEELAAETEQLTTVLTPDE